MDEVGDLKRKLSSPPHVTLVQPAIIVAEDDTDESDSESSTDESTELDERDSDSNPSDQDLI
jgi:hypothetical protein